MKVIKNQAFKIQIGTAVLAVIGIVGFFVTYNSRIQATEASIRHLNAKTALYAERYDAQQEKQVQAEMGLVEIKTKLISIESMLLEMRTDLKSH